MKGKITFKLVDDQRVSIIQDGKPIGSMFSPAGSGDNCVNAVQVCGFTEAYDLWGCGIFRGFKDVQLLFDKAKMSGEDTHIELHKCTGCYRDPCQCENPKDKLRPFKVKTEKEIEDRIIYSKKSWRPDEIFKDEDKEIKKLMCDKCQKEVSNLQVGTDVSAWGYDEICMDCWREEAYKKQ